ncbi:hypothetical protein A3Q32_01030 [Alcanivorax sp. KX64203]|nr:hypothetical protein A3Q32_01030 [Alcanivorax sp. KX64203]
MESAHFVRNKDCRYYLCVTRWLVTITKAVLMIQPSLRFRAPLVPMYRAFLSLKGNITPCACSDQGIYTSLMR